MEEKVGDVDLAYLRKDTKWLALRRDDGWPRLASKVETMIEVEMLPTWGNSTTIRGSEGKKEQPFNFVRPKTLT